MFPLKGEYTTAKVMADKIDAATRSQIYSIISHPAFTNPIAIMQDCHKGAGAVIGFTMKMGDKVIPNIIGRDKGCGVLTFNIGRGIITPHMSRKDLDLIIRRNIPFGTKVHTGKGIFDKNNKKFWHDLNFQMVAFTSKFNATYGTNYSHKEIDLQEIKEICNKIDMDFERALLSLGTLGSGNHFIELGKSKTKEYWMTIHSGSRQFGSKVCIFWQRKAGKGELAYLTEKNMFNYLVDMLVAQKYAEENRRLMKNIILDILDVEPIEIIESVHNYMDYSDWIIRKGAISSYKDQKIIIPLTMEDGILLCEGKSNPEWNNSAPHGAGRVNSRTWANENLSNKEAQKRMKEKDIYYSTLPTDETRDAYKNGQMIKDTLEPTATLIKHIKPVLAIKDGKKHKRKKFKK